MAFHRSAGLTSKAWWAREDFPWSADLENAYPAIKAVLGDVLTAALTSLTVIMDCSKAEMMELFGARGDQGGNMPKSWVRVGDDAWPKKAVPIFLSVVLHVWCLVCAEIRRQALI